MKFQMLIYMTWLLCYNSTVHPFQNLENKKQFIHVLNKTTALFKGKQYYINFFFITASVDWRRRVYI